MNQFVALKPDAKSYQMVSNLALIYLRHRQPYRALALGVAAMAFGPITPQLGLIFGDAFLRTGQPEQAEAILSRFHTEKLLEPEPTSTERAAAGILMAKALHKSGDVKGARTALADAAARADGLS